MVRIQLIGKEEAIDIWGTKPVNAAMRSTLVRVAKTAVGTASAEIRRVYNIKKAALDKKMASKVAGDSVLITVSGRGISLSYFGARQFVVNKTITRGKARLVTKRRSRVHAFQGVEVEVEKGNKTQLRSAFMAKMKSGHIGVMHRWSGDKKMKGKNKAAIGEKAVVSLTTMIQNHGVQPPILAKVQDDFDKVFKQQLAYQMSKGKA